MQANNVLPKEKHFCLKRPISPWFQLSAVYESALLQLAITGRTSPVRRRPSTEKKFDIFNGGMIKENHFYNSQSMIVDFGDDDDDVDDG